MSDFIDHTPGAESFDPNHATPHDLGSTAQGFADGDASGYQLNGFEAGSFDSTSFDSTSFDSTSFGSESVGSTAIVPGSFATGEFGSAAAVSEHTTFAEATTRPSTSFEQYGSDQHVSGQYGSDQYGSDQYGSDQYGAGAPASQPETVAASIRVSVAIVEPHGPTRERMMRLLDSGGTPFGSIAELADRLTGAIPVVVVLGPSCATPAELASAERLIEMHPSLGTILVVEELTTALLQQALRSGVKDVLTLTGDEGQFAAAVHRVAVTLDAAPRRSYSGGEDRGYEGTPEEEASGPLGPVLTVFSTKGGAGKSGIATNLAVTLAQRSSQPVCLIDADLQFGDVAVMLKLTPHHTIVDAVASIDRLDAALLESLLVTHEISGLRVLPAPLEPAFADQVGAAEMVAIVECLRTFCSYVVVDTPAYFNDVVLGLVEASDKVVLVAGMDIPNIKNVKIGLQTLRLLNTPMEKLMLVLNRSNSKVKLDIGEVERTLQVKADALVPSDVLVPQSVNKGVPVVLHAPKSSVAKALQQLGDLFLPSGIHSKRR